jgi:hypothetical protein
MKEASANVVASLGERIAIARAAANISATLSDYLAEQAEEQTLKANELELSIRDNPETQEEIALDAKPDFSDRAKPVLYKSAMVAASLDQLRNWLLVEKYELATLPPNAEPKMIPRLEHRIDLIELFILKAEKAANQF